MSIDNKKKTKLVTMVVIALIILLTVIFFMKFFGTRFLEIFHILRRGNQQEIMDYLNSQSKIRGLISVYFISILQVVSIVIPGIAIQISSGLIYGWFPAFIVNYLGFLTGNAVVFYVARRVGKEITSVFIDESGKSSKLICLINDNNPAMTVGMACLVPGVPNGIIPYLGARAEIRWRRFVEAIAYTCWPQILCNCIAGHFLIRGKYMFTILTFIAQIVLIILMQRYRYKLSRYFKNTL
ncbi:MAG: TVP38/TMEM64 family protein [Solobacterium sp.]|nr:TVP38/TMEM64 family protein [Solobacterium sp.]